MALYSNIYPYINGGLLQEAINVDTALEGDIPDVMTLVKNWAGITPAPLIRRATIQNCLPLPGVEVDFESKMLNFEEVELMLQEGGSGLAAVSNGYIVEVPRSAAVGQNAGVNFTFRGTPSAFE